MLLDSIIESMTCGANITSEIQWVRRLITPVMATTEAQRELAAKEIARKIERRGEILSDILERYDSERCGINGKRHVGSDEARASRKLESVISGEADDMKQVAYVKALEYVSA